MQIDGITIKNFKNVIKGELAFENARRPGCANVLALYGQNGSGKTALIDSLVILRELLWGNPIPERFGSYVTEGSEQCEIEYRFHRRDEKAGKTFKIAYRVSFKPDKSPDEYLVSDLFHFPLNQEDSASRCPLARESLIYGFESDDGTRKRMHSAAAADINEGISPSSFREFINDLCDNPRREKRPDQKLHYLREHDGDITVETRNIYATEAPLFIFETEYMDLLQQGKSFLFSSETCKAISMFCTDGDLKFVHEAVQEVSFKLGITGTEEAGLLDRNLLPLYSQPFNEATAIVSLNPKNDFTANASTEYGNKPIMVPLHMGPDPHEYNEISLENMKKLKRLEPGLNTILDAIVPGLNIEFSGSTGYADSPELDLQVFAERNGRKIPLACESNGIKRIISVAMLLVNAFNDPDFVAVIDELDAGIYEYLLGEMLEVFQDEGMGQLIFTSHNLRALEKLDKGYVAFTTTDPENRYTRLKNVKPTNNLRDVYLRCLHLGSNGGELYNAKSPTDLADAFILAGEHGDYSVGRR